MAVILGPGKETLSRAKTLLSDGKPIGFPTETVYGLAADAANESAILSVYQVKARPAFDPLIVHVAIGVASVSDLVAMQLVDSSTIDAKRSGQINSLIERFWPGPLTLILPKHHSVSDLITSGLNMVGIRMPDHPVAQSILKEFGRPLAAPSANRFGRISPTSAKHVEEELGGLIDLIVDGGDCDRGVESTVVGLGEDCGFNLLRPGSLPVEDIEKILGETLQIPSAKSKAASPGTLASHYAPERKFIQLPKEVGLMAASDWKALGITSATKIALLIPCGQLADSNNFAKHFDLAGARTLSLQGDEREASKNLFRYMRELDALSPDVIVCGPILNEGGLWIAIKDRLKRAATR
jgi:L-threonylcarbamoyladenylate synthase